MKITLIEPWNNPKGRKLVQEGDELWVLSECCAYVIESLHRLDDGTTWMRCMNCNEVLQENSTKLWNCNIQRIGPVSNTEAWNEWARDIFGFTAEFKLVVEP